MAEDESAPIVSTGLGTLPRDGSMAVVVVDWWLAAESEPAVEELGATGAWVVDRDGAGVEDGSSPRKIPAAI